MRRWIHLLLLTALLAAFTPSTMLRGEEESKPKPKEEQKEKDKDSSGEAPIPPAETHYMGREIAQTMHYAGAPWLVRQSREKEESVSTAIREMKIQPGMTVCDMGCGNGYYALKIARLVGEKGKVIGVDIQQEMLDMMMRRAKRAELDAIVKPVLGTLTDPKLEEGTIDMLIMVDVYHEFSHPELMLKAIRRGLKPDGQLVLLEFRAEDENVPIKPLHKMSKQQILKEYTANGFKLTRQFDGLPWQHMMVFQRDDAPEAEKQEPKKDEGK